jgi:hypothetical protein
MPYHRTLETHQETHMNNGSDPVRGYVAYDPAFRTSLDKNDVLTVEAALACYQAYCRTLSERELGTRLHAIDSDVDHIRELLELDHTDLILDIHEMARLDAALTHYQTHRKAEGTDANEPAWAQDAQIEQVRQKLRRPPPESPRQRPRK